MPCGHRDQFRSRAGEFVGPRQARGRCPTGALFEQPLTLYSAGATRTVRRVTVVLDTPTRDDEALAVSRWLGDAITFQGKHDVWAPVGYARCLVSRILRVRGDHDGARAALAPLEVTDVYLRCTDDVARKYQDQILAEAGPLTVEPDAKEKRLKRLWTLSDVAGRWRMAEIDPRALAQPAGRSLDADRMRWHVYGSWHICMLVHVAPNGPTPSWRSQIPRVAASWSCCASVRPR